MKRGLIVIRRGIGRACLAILALGLLAGCDVTTGGTSLGLGGAGSGGTAGGGSATPSASASVLEQLSLELINRARLNPAAEAAAGGIAIDEGIPGRLDTTPKQPLAMNAKLSQVARAHSEDMLNRDFFDHFTPEGISPFERMSNAGYVYTAAGENLARRGTPGILNLVDAVEVQHDDLFIDTPIIDRGHRITMLNADFREAGIGIVHGDYTEDGTVFDSIMQSQDYGTPLSGGTFVRCCAAMVRSHRGSRAGGL